ncbi:MAG TPA: hypothetical protein VKV23_05500, partial [Acidimicrobiales bacterium]|nr:hypothetical protein [Acidimicrobiales bacterium]
MIEAPFRQVVPRPDGAVVRHAPPWRGGAGLAEPVLPALRAVLRARAPSGARAGVLVPLLERPSGLATLLTRRAASLRS